ncbi:DUF6160 family protein [Acinetobacter schindleri]|uniref:putative pilus system protein FilA n=1 Tax=Acinetobacter schindleri TaxID=108981 RepID=UPI000972BDAE|nr:DUF6160 family protein [Acinetobacter schindleri]APX63639.1 hypothetical protein AsACE_CH02266 [Acinetobacter schindleri]
MKKFTKLALISSMAISANAMAMQAMDDSALSATTGQDGINIGIGISKITIDKLFIHDNDGLAANGTVGTTAGSGGTGKAGAIVIQGITDTDLQKTITTTNGSTFDNKDFGLYIGANYSGAGANLLTSKNLADIRIDSDAGTSATGGAFLNIAAEVSGLEIHIGEIGVTASNDKPGATATSIRRGGDLAGNYNAILGGLSILTGKMNANIQVGAAPQGAMIKLDSKMLGGLEIKALSLLDQSTKGKSVGTVDGLPTGTAIASTKAGEIYVESIKIADADKKDLTISSNISVYNDAYVGSTSTVGKAAHIRILNNDTGAKDQYISGIHLGKRNGGSIGDMEVQGLQTYYSPSLGVYNKGSILSISGR